MTFAEAIEAMRAGKTVWPTLQRERVAAAREAGELPADFEFEPGIRYSAEAQAIVHVDGTIYEPGSFLWDAVTATDWEVIG